MASRRCAARAAIATGLVALLGCATSTQLTRQSYLEMARGNLEGAYLKARRALDLEAGNAEARSALRSTGERLLAARRWHVLDVARADTVAAARECVALEEFRDELETYQVTFPPDTAFLRREEEIRAAAAGILYRDAEERLAAGRAKEAHRQFRDAGAIFPSYRDVQRRTEQAHERAVVRVAVLPLANQTEVPGLTLELHERMTAELGRRVDIRRLPYTRLVDRSRVLAGVPVAALAEMTRERAARLGRELGAGQVVWGRVYALRADTRDDAFQQSVYRKVVDRDSSGRRRERFLEQGIDVVAREREISLRVEVEVMDVQTLESLAWHADQRERFARVIYAPAKPEGDEDDYCLVPPSLASSEPERARSAESDWKRHFGEWTVPDFVECAQDQHDRVHFEAAHRGEFLRDGRRKPVYLAELPGVSDLASVALENLWEPVLAELRELDQRELDRR